jgi:hypothetical protein
MSNFNEIVSGVVAGVGIFTGLAGQSPIEEVLNKQNDSFDSSLQEKAKNINPSLIGGATENDQLQSSIAASEEERIKKRDEDIDSASISDNQPKVSGSPDPDSKSPQLKGDYGQKLDIVQSDDDDNKTDLQAKDDSDPKY